MLVECGHLPAASQMAARQNNFEGGSLMIPLSEAIKAADVTTLLQKQLLFFAASNIVLQNFAPAVM
jgi:hypothetical protein